jgi:glycolate dehydrogenase FAD-binding subunit
VTVAESLGDLLPLEALAPAGDPATPAQPGLRPDFIVRPGSTEEVASVMSWASADGVGVLPVGSGRRADPVRRSGPYIVLSTERLAGIDVYEPADLTFTARAGTTLATIDDALRAHGQWIPFDPPHVPERSLGGLVAVGESGPLWTGYGELRNHVLGMTVVTGDGRILELGGRVVKNVAGYDLVRPMVGSRGTLAVVTSVCVRAFPEPAVDRVVVLRGESFAKLVAHARAVGTAPVLPASSVIVDRMEALGGAAALLVRLHGARATVDADQAVLERHMGVELETAPAPGDVVLAARDHGADAPVILVASALPSRLAEVVSALDRLGPSAVAVDAYAARLRVGVAGLDSEAIGDARESIERLGGAMRVTRLPDAAWPEGLDSESSADEADLTARLEKAFDPSGVLWPARR